MKNINVNSKSLTSFLVLCEKAEKAGLQFIKNKKGEYCLTIGDISEEITVQIRKWDITAQNGHGQGHTMLDVWTRREADVLAGYIDASLADSNPKRFIEIGASPNTIADKTDLEYFIKTHTKSK